MIPRGDLDIDWWTLFRAMADSFGRTTGTEGRAAERRFDPQGRVVAFLSVRSGLDCALSATGWPRGSEILMSAVNLPAMATIVAEHGYVPVPVDVSPVTLEPDCNQIASRITDKTRAILVAHLFGSRLDLSSLHAVIPPRGIELWEDLAQGFHGIENPTASAADIRFFSFGLIKTHTALGGAVVTFRDGARAEQCRALQSAWPQQRSSALRRRIHRAMLIRLLAQHGCYTAVCALAGKLGWNLDDILSRALRGFKPGSLLHQLRHRPSATQLRLLDRRLAHTKGVIPTWKVNLAAEYRERLPIPVQIGAAASFPLHWVFPILSQNPAGLRDQLWKHGYDATVRASQLRVIPPAETHLEWTTPLATEWVPQLLYLPMHPAMSSRDIEAIATIVAEQEAPF